MPVILSPDTFAAWFDPASTQAELLDLLRPAPHGALAIFPDDARVGNVKNDDARLIEPRSDMFPAKAGCGGAAPMFSLATRSCRVWTAGVDSPARGERITR